MKMDILLGVLRHILTGLGGVLVAKGLADDSGVGEAAGAVCTLIGFGWSVWHKRQTAIKASSLVVMGVGLMMLGVAGCTSVTATRNSNGTATIKADSFMTSVDGMQFTYTDTNGVATSLNLQKAGVDNQALTTVTGGLIEMAKIGVLFAAKAPTNSPAVNTNPAAHGP